MSSQLDQIALTPEQKRHVVRLAEQTGMPWDEVLGNALAAYRPQSDWHDENLSAILRELAELQQEPVEDEHGLLRPTSFAFETTIRLLANAAIIAGREGRSIPRGCVSTDSQGGVRVEWVRPANSVHLAVPATSNESGYIFHECGDRYATESLTAENLALWLREIA